MNALQLYVSKLLGFGRVCVHQAFSSSVINLPEMGGGGLNFFMRRCKADQDGGSDEARLFFAEAHVTPRLLADFLTLARVTF